MATRLTIVTNARTELQESTAGFWADTELQRWYDDANSEITTSTKQEATASSVLVSGTEAYALPADFYLARRVELQSTAGSASNWFNVLPYPLDLRRPGDPINTTNLTSTPVGFFIFAGDIYFVPIPDQAYSSTLYYFKNAVISSSDSDTPSYPEGIAQQRVDTAIKLFICAMALRKRQDSAYITYSGDYNIALAGIVKDALDRGSTAPLQVLDDWAYD